MGRNSKYKKSTLNKFKDLTDEELLIALHSSIIEYVKMEKSKEEANKILSKYNQPIIYNNYKSDIISNRYRRLIDCAKFRNLTVPEEWYEVAIEEQDIINRIEEEMYEQLNWIDEHNYMFDLVDENEEVEDRIDNDENEEYIWPSEKQQEEVYSLYRNIIKTEFTEKTNSKSLKKDK